MKRTAILVSHAILFALRAAVMNFRTDPRHSLAGSYPNLGGGLLAGESAVLPVSLVIVSDYLADDGDEELRRSVRAYAQDPLGVPSEIIVMLPSGNGAEPAVDLGGAASFLCPSVIVRSYDSDRSAELKDAALQHCRCSLVAVVEADCVPEAGWLGALTSAMARDPHIDVVSGRTSYGSEGMMLRVMSLLDRGFMECRDRQGRIIHVSNNGALYRREVLELYPYEIDPSPFVSAHCRQHAMLHGGVLMETVPEAVSIHAYGGWSFIWDVRRNKGFQFAQMELRRKTKSGIRPGLMLALRAVNISFNENRGTVGAVWRQFCGWKDLPLLLLMMLVVRIPEFTGALLASDSDAFAKSTRYR